MTKNILHLGYGEIGGCIGKLEEEVGNRVYKITNKTKVLPPKGFKIDVLNIAIPYVGDGENFFQSVKQVVDEYSPELIINHGTVPVGTTKKLEELLGRKVAYSPVRGMHPDLYPSVKYAFVKYVSTEEAAEHLRSIGIQKVQVKKCEEIELLKILSTTYYGWNILFAGEVKKICDQLGLDYDSVYTDGNKTYNEGYSQLGLTHVVRPVLYPPKGAIGGHCIKENFELLPDGDIKDICKKLNEKNISECFNSMG